MPSQIDDERFRATQDRHFEHADRARYHWTTEDPAFAPLEDALLLPRLVHLAQPCLEIGCGEGTNLARLATSGHPVGIDRYAAKAHFASRAVPAARLAVADATALPFHTGAFPSVFIRDLLHHLPDPGRALAEAVRVLAPRGQFLLLEPNGRSPFTRLQARLVSAEAGIRDFTPTSVRAMVAHLPLDDVQVEMAQGFPLRRMLLHYRFGVPRLGRTPAVANILAGIERLGERAMPESRWSYVIVRARRR